APAKRRGPLVVGSACVALVLLGALGMHVLRDKPQPAVITTIEPSDAAIPLALVDKIPNSPTAVPSPPPDASLDPRTASPGIDRPSQPARPEKTMSVSAKHERTKSPDKAMTPAPPPPPSPQTRTCFADVSSIPTDADIMRDGTLIGKTH